MESYYTTRRPDAIARVTPAEEVTMPTGILDGDLEAIRISHG